MKKINLILALLIAFGSASVASAQQVMTFSKAAEQGLHLDSLEQVYPAALGNRDSINPVPAIIADEAMGQYFALWKQFLQGFGAMLPKVENDKGYKVFLKFYYDTNGRVELMLYNFLGDKPDETLQQQYEAAFKQYVSTNDIQISASRKFSQCGNMTLAPSQSRKE